MSLCSDFLSVTERMPLQKVNMINIIKLRTILAGDEAYFPIQWDDEKYKWEFQKHLYSAAR